MNAITGTCNNPQNTNYVLILSQFHLNLEFAYLSLPSHVFDSVHVPDSNVSSSTHVTRNSTVGGVILATL